MWIRPGFSTFQLSLAASAEHRSEKHTSESSTTLVKCVGASGRCCVGGELAIAINSFVVVNVEKSADRSKRRGLAIHRRFISVEASRSTELGPASIIRVDVVQLEATLLKRGSTGSRHLLTATPQLAPVNVCGISFLCVSRTMRCKPPVRAQSGIPSG